jgi:hypothetical protein
MEGCYPCCLLYELRWYWALRAWIIAICFLLKIAHFGTLIPERSLIMPTILNRYSPNYHTTWIQLIHLQGECSQDYSKSPLINLEGWYMEMHPKVLCPQCFGGILRKIIQQVEFNKHFLSLVKPIYSFLFPLSLLINCYQKTFRSWTDQHTKAWVLEVVTYLG